MRKLAIFVEGYTELLFMDRLISEVAEKNQIAIELRQIRGGGARSGKPKRIVELQVPVLDPEKTLYFLIADCGGEDAVAQRIKEEHENLSKAGFEKIIGLRDVYPKFLRKDMPKLRIGLRYGVKTNLIPVQFVLSAMELEAWFLAEHNHYQNVDPLLTVERIQNHLGFDPVNDDMTIRDEPANDLAAAYALVGKLYAKGDSKNNVDRLDFTHLYAALPHRINELNELITTIDSFIEPSLTG